MTIKNPRISVSLNPSSDAILTRLSELTSQSKSSIVAEFLEETCIPMFQRMIPVLEAASIASEEAKSATKRGFEQAEDRLREALGVSHDLFDSISKPLLDDAEKIIRRAPKSRAGAVALVATSRPATKARPPHVTRGSGIPNTSKIITKSPIKTPSASASLKKALPNRSKQASKPLKHKLKG